MNMIVSQKQRAKTQRYHDRRREEILKFHQIKAEDRRRQLMDDEAKKRREEEEEKIRRKEEFKEIRRREKEKERGRVVDRER
jgi:hypothetical protein